MMLKIYLAGMAILLTAILANLLASVLGLTSWYDLIRLLSEQGTTALRKIRFIDWVWLLLVYPLLLAYGYRAGEWTAMLWKG